MRLHERLLRTQRLRGGMQPCIRLASLGGWRVEARRLRRQVKARRVGAASDFYELLQRVGGQRVHRQERIDAAVLADAGHLCARKSQGTAPIVAAVSITSVIGSQRNFGFSSMKRAIDQGGRCGQSWTPLGDPPHDPPPLD
jgi:hypothetical protein